MMLAVEDTQVVIFAAGAGLRVGGDVPKPLVELGGKTLMQRCIDLFLDDGFLHFVFILGFRAPVIEEHIRKHLEGTGVSSKFHVEPFDQGKTRALRASILGGKVDPRLRSFMVFPDDVYLMKGLPIYALTNHVFAIKKWDAKASLVLAPGEEWPFGTADLENTGRIARFEEKPFIERLSSTGIYILEPAVEAIILGDASGAYKNFERDLLPALAAKGTLNGIRIPSGAWLPVNTQKEYEKAKSVIDGATKESDVRPWPK